MPSIAIAGCGAIGGIIGGFVWDKEDTVLICKNPEITQAIRTHGLYVKGVRGNWRFTPRAYANFSDQREKFDIIILTMKATAVYDAAKDALNYLKPDGFMVTFQNGIVEDKLLEIVPEEKLIGGIVGFGGTLLSPGVVEMTSRGELIIGERNGKVTERVKELQRILNYVTPTRISENIWGAKYSKLLINACITTMGAVSGLYLGEMLRRKEFRKIFGEIIYEGVKVAQARGIKLEKISGVPIDKLAPSENDRKKGFTFSRFLKDTIIRAIGWRFRRLKSSSLQSLERGRKTEVDFINGTIVKYGKEAGVPTPVNEKIVKMVHEIEDGIRKISPENLEELLPLIPY